MEENFNIQQNENHPDLQEDNQKESVGFEKNEGEAEAASVESSADADSASAPADDSNFSGGLTPHQIVEAVIFSSDSPLPAAKIASIMGIRTAREIRDIVEQLNGNYRQMNCAFQIEEIAGGFQMMTRPEFSSYLQQLYKVRSESKLSAAALETLAVIAYKQPVLRAEIEAIRGVACGEMIRTLMDKDLIKIVGRAEELGRPMLYGTTKKFLQVFGLASLDDLPKVPELAIPNRAAAPSQDTPAAQETPQQQQEQNAASSPESTPDGSPVPPTPEAAVQETPLQ